MRSDSVTPEERASTIWHAIAEGSEKMDTVVATIRAAENDALERAAQLMFDLYSDEEANHIRAMKHGRE
jgi:hypothetical protein